MEAFKKIDIYLVSSRWNWIIIQLDSSPLQICQPELLRVTKALILRTGSGTPSFITDVISRQVLLGTHRYLLGNLSTHDESLEGITKQRNF